jgi:Fe-S-cluster containining protein
MTSPIEMLPLAIKILDNKKENIYLEKLDSMPKMCVLVSHSQSGGLCSAYEDRAVICRLFGWSKTKDKQNKPRMSLCKLILEEGSVNLSKQQIESAPDIVNWAERVRSLCPELAELMPINLALKMMLEKLVLIQRFS